MVDYEVDDFVNVKETHASTKAWNERAKRDKLFVDEYDDVEEDEGEDEE